MPRDSRLRDKIIEAAIGILYREGVDRITMRALAKKLGYSPASIYLHFKGKDELEREIALRGFGALYDAIEAALGIEDPLEAIAEASRRYLAFGFSNPQLYRLMFQELRPLEGGAQQPAVARLREGVLSIYRRGVETGAFRSCDPELETAVGWAALHGLLQLVTADRIASYTLVGDLAPLQEAVIEARLRSLRP